MPRKHPRYSPQWLAERVRDLMVEQQWESQSAYLLAQRSGVSESYAADILAGDGPKKPRPETLHKLSAAFALTVDAFLGEEPLEVAVYVTSSDQDVLNAVALVEQSSLPEVVQQALTEFIAQRSELPSLQPVLEAMRTAREKAARTVVQMTPDKDAESGPH